LGVIHEWDENPIFSRQASCAHNDKTTNLAVV
jgi:hypothetical protein